MKILQINAIYKKFSTGRTTQEMHEYLVSKGLDSYVASPRLNCSSSDKFYQIGNIVDWKLHALLSRIVGKQGYFSRLSTKKLINYIDSISPDIIILRNLHGNYVNLPMLLDYIGKKDIATTVVLHDSWFYTGKCFYYIEENCDKWKTQCQHCPAKRKSNTSYLFDYSKQMFDDRKHLFSRIRRLAVVGVSQWVTNDAAISLLGNAKRVECIYNWIDLKKFSPRDCNHLRDRLDIHDKYIVLGVAMAWNQQKGIDVFHQLATLLPENYQIVLIGDYSAIEEKSPNIKYLGTLSDPNQLADYYSMADIFVNPTVQETFGKTTAEAMASGTPVVAYNGTATPELVGTDGSCGYLIDSLNANDYKNAIIKMCESGLADFGRNCRNRSELLFDKEKNIQKYIQLFDELCSLKIEC